MKKSRAPEAAAGGSMNKTIDLEKQLRELLKREETMAFFDFELRAGTAGAVSGVCKISKPREGQSKSKYLALLFIMDTLNAEDRKKISAVFNDINWDLFRESMPGFKNAFPIPYMTLNSEIYFMETDIYLQKDVAPDQAYVSGTLFPALISVTGMKAGELVFWEDSDQKPQTAPPPAEPSLIEKVRAIFK